MSDSMTCLTCAERGCYGLKTFESLASGEIKKTRRKIGTKFYWEKLTVTGLEDIFNILNRLQYEPDKFLIRGEIRNIGSDTIVRRYLGTEPDVADKPRNWVMLDFDKTQYPDELDVAQNPLEVIKWLKNQLPENFREAQCVYKFSSSQNVLVNVDQKPAHNVSAHLYYWCDKPVADIDWKRYFKSIPLKLDKSLFNPVQPHYTANPLFKGLSDPIQNRVGVC